DACDLAAHFGLIGREQGAREIDFALDGHSLYLRCLHGDHGTAASTATAASSGSGSAARRLTGRPLAGRDGHRERRDDNDSHIQGLLFLYVPYAPPTCKSQLASCSV